MKPRQPRRTKTIGPGKLPFRKGVPLYRSLFDSLKEKIASGAYSPPAQFPSERELKAAYGVSEVTIRRAIAELGAEGLVETSRGRRTRVVSRVATTQYGATVQGIIEGLFQHSWNTETTILHVGVEPAGAEIAQAMNMARNTPLQKTINVAKRDGELFAYATTYVPRRIADRLSANGLSSLPYVLQYERAGFKPRSGRQFLSACPAPKDAAAALETDPSAPMLKLVRTLVDERGDTVEHVVAFFPWNRFEYFISLSDSR